MLATDLGEADLARYTATQLNTFFPDHAPVTDGDLRIALPPTLRRLEGINRRINGRFYRRDGEVFFDHLHADQYAAYLYLLSWYLSQQKSGERVATKLFLLNKALHALDLYFEVELPEVFLLAHAVGSVIGKAKYGNYLVIGQNCTVGGIDDVYPVLGEGIVMCSGSSVLGKSVLGDSVTVGAGALVVNTDVPSGHTVVGRAKEARTFPSRVERWRVYFE